MKNTIITVTCDDCGTVVLVGQQYINVIDMDSSNKTTYELCLHCAAKRLQLSFDDIPVGTKCKLCDGDGYTKESYGHNEYTTHKCEVCKGAKCKLHTVIGGNTVIKITKR